MTGTTGLVARTWARRTAAVRTTTTRDSRLRRRTPRLALVAVTAVAALTALPLTGPAAARPGPAGEFEFDGEYEVERVLRHAPDPATQAAPFTCRPAFDADATSILIVGDSVAQGSVDDWTWRYRLWRHLTGTGAVVDFVGPRDDLLNRQTDEFGSHDYADRDFDQDHAARWGMAFARQDYPIRDLVAACRPDVVVEALGINDLTWLGAPPEAVVDEARTFITDARAADPDVDVVLAELPQTWFANVTAYNDALRGLADEPDTPTSRVVTAATGTGFTEWVDTYDPAHLAATGEVKMAAGVADALASLGVGTPYPRPLPQVDNGPTRPAVLAAADGDGHTDLSWTLPPGATGVFVWVRDVTDGEKWHQLPDPLEPPTRAWTAGGLVNYHHYRFRLQALKGTAVAEHRFSNVVKVWPHNRAPGRVSLTLIPGRHRLTARWTAAKRATSYIVTWVRRGSGADPRTRHTTDTRMRLARLASGKRYRVTVTALNDRTPGRTATATARPR